MTLPRLGARRDPRSPKRTLRRPCVELMEERRLMTVFTVTSTADSGTGTLRAELTLANATPGLNTIDFAIGTGRQTIALASPLPAITNTVIIDGTSQPGSAGTPTIEINGAKAPGDGLTISAPDCTIEGLVIDAFSGNQIHLAQGSDGSTIEDDFVGVDPTGSFARAGAGDGLLIDSNDDLIGGMPSTARNVIAGNGGNGITVNGSDNRIINNAIGVGSGASRPIGNGGDGIAVNGPGNTIGGAVAGSQNVIAGNRSNGIALFSADNLVAGNAIGVAAGGSSLLSNAGNGLVVTNAADNTIGGTVSPAVNVISGNELNGIVLTGAGTIGTLIVGNLVGTATGASVALGNGEDGLLITDGASSTQVGGIYSSMQNVISGNGDNGIAINGASYTTVQGNAIGTAPTGSASIGNAADGISIAGSNNLIGGANVAANIIRNNGATGIVVASGHQNAILSNSIYNNTHQGINIALATNDAIAAPTLRAATTINGQTVIRGVLAEQPKSAYLVQFYSNATVDPSGFGEGQVFLGQATIKTHRSGVVQFSVKSPVALSAGTIVTATATDPSSNTSAFSTAVKSTVRTIRSVTVTHTTLAQAIALSFGNPSATSIGTGTTTGNALVTNGGTGEVVSGVPYTTIDTGLDTIGGLGLPSQAVPAVVKKHSDGRRG